MKIKKQKIEEIVKNVLNEVVSDIVYHGTSIIRLNSILKNNKFMSSVAVGTSSDKRVNKGRTYFFSIARSKTSNYLVKLGRNSCIMVLDGQKLSQNYKGSSVDYWGPSWNDSDEMEDRIFTEKPYIENALKYIEEVHIYSIPSSEDYLNLLKQNEKYLKENNKNCFYYVNERDFLMLNKKKSFNNLDDLLEYMEEKGITIEKSDNNSYNFGSIGEKSFKQIIDVIRGIELGDKKYLNWNNQWYRYISSYPNDFVSQIKVLIHNSRTDFETRKYMDDIFTYMKNNKIKNFEELASFLGMKLEKLRQKDKDK